jgi:hypothetical protein
MSENTLHSGGAAGADALFGQYAAKAGHLVQHYSFHGHKADTSCPPKSLIMLNAVQEKFGDAALTNAAKFMGRHFPTRSNHTNSLLRRNFWQIIHTNKIYAVASIGERGIVNGGTGWAVTMGILKGTKKVYVFDQELNYWMKLNAVINDLRKREIFWDYVGEVPRPTGEYTGIGSRNLTQGGMKAIGALYE